MEIIKENISVFKESRHNHERTLPKIQCYHTCILMKQLFIYYQWGFKFHVNNDQLKKKIKTLLHLDRMSCKSFKVMQCHQKGFEKCSEKKSTLSMHQHYLPCILGFPVWGYKFKISIIKLCI